MVARYCECYSIRYGERATKGQTHTQQCVFRTSHYLLRCCLLFASYHNQNIERVVHIEIDDMVVYFSKKYFPKLGKAFEYVCCLDH